MRDKLKNYESGYCDGKEPCEVCGKTKNYPYWRTFDKNGWFRGDDTVKGNICHTCMEKLKFISLQKEK